MKINAIVLILSIVFFITGCVKKKGYVCECKIEGQKYKVNNYKTTYLKARKPCENYESVDTTFFGRPDVRCRIKLF